MPMQRVLHSMAGMTALLAALGATAAHAAPFMIVGNDEKLTWDDHGKGVLHPTGKDTVLIVDLANPEEPKVVATLGLENSVVGPPVNVAITPNGALALVADSVTVTGSEGALKQVPTDKLFVIDLKASPPKLIDTLTLGKQPSGLSINAVGTLALVANRVDGTVSVLKIDGNSVKPIGTVPMGGSVSTVEFTPDGKRALAVMSPANKITVLDVNGDTVTDTKLDLPTYQFPYNVVVTPDGKTALTADNGFGGSGDGNIDAVSVINLDHQPPYVSDRFAVADAPEGLAVSPTGDVAVVADVYGSFSKGSWFYHPHGLITVMAIDNGRVHPVKQIEVGAVPEAAVFTPDGKYLYVGNYLDEDFSILRVNGTDVTDTGKRFKVPGHPASARMGPR
ncbi:MAG TPA: hypothetical protein VN702_16695 [Acetobacteraceae bacterium]|nr:hypothetical protein [Acetobacteraceae bacterium]